MLNAGVDRVFRDVILGRSLQGMDVHYLVPSEDDLKAAMEDFSRHGSTDKLNPRGLEKKRFGNWATVRQQLSKNNTPIYLD